MKIGIITLNGYFNYGNRLQNYAVIHTLKKKYNCSAVTLEGHWEKANKIHSIVSVEKDELLYLLDRIPALKNKLMPLQKRRTVQFMHWSKKNIPTKRYFNCGILPKELSGVFDWFVTGSDQVWNYRFKNNRLENTLLEFVEDNSKKIALSASFGVESIPLEMQELYINNLSKFHAISVREETGAKIVKDLLDKDVPVLIDPVMMLTTTEWLQVSKKPQVDCNKKYVLKYYLGDESTESVDKWAKNNGYEIYELLNPNYPDLYATGPGEFIELINKASLICSDSFHCIAFSILFKKPFIVFAREGVNDYMQSRLETLFNKFEIHSRWAGSLSEEDYLKCDYSKIETILYNERMKFESFLDEAIHKEILPIE